MAVYYITRLTTKELIIYGRLKQQPIRALPIVGLSIGATGFITALALEFAVGTVANIRIIFNL